MGEAIIGVVLPIVTVSVFLGGMFYRIAVWRRLPSPKMTLFPAPASAGQRFRAVLKETFLFSSLFKADKALWVMGWIFHACLVLILVGHFRVVSWLPDKLLMALGMDEAAIDKMSSLAGGAAGIVILATGLVILARRLSVPRVREISGTGDYFAMLLIVAIVLTGDAMRFLGHFDLAETREYFYGLITLSAVAVPKNPWFLAHFLMGQLLLMYMPFSKILHFGGIFFSQRLVHRH